MPPQQSSIRSSACFHRYPLPVSGKDEPGCQGISEAVMPGQAAGPGVGREPSPTPLPTAASVATVGRDRFPTPAPTGDVHTTVGRRPLPTVPPTVAWQPCLAEPGFSFSWPASVFSVCAAAARTPLYTAPVRELVILRCVKKRESGPHYFKTLRVGQQRYISIPTERGESNRKTIRSNHRRYLNSYGTLKEG
jgi:hypothetical protein